MKRLLREVGTQVGETVSRSALEKKPGTKFWQDVSNSVNKRVEGSESVEIGASHVAAAFKEYGGTISAPGKGPGSRHAKYLTIPISPKARGTNVSDWPKKSIRLVNTGKSVLICLVKGAEKLKNKRRGGKRGSFVKQAFSDLLEPLFVLKKSVTHKPNPWWPSASKINAAIEKAGQLWFKRGK